MARGFSVHVGVDKANPAFQVTELKGCVKDAEAMMEVARVHNFENRKIFRNEEAKFEPVRDAVLQAAGELKDGDIFLFTFSGHGSTHPAPRNENDQEPDRQNETILLHDCVLIDDYPRRNLWSKFAKGVRILGIADSCHSGSVLFTGPVDLLPAPVIALAAASEKEKAKLPRKKVPIAADRREPVFREITLEDTERIREASPEIHRTITDELLPFKKLDATLMTLAACRDQERARDGESNGLFTQALLQVLGENPSPKNYDELITRITAHLASKDIPQHPVKFPRDNPDINFVGQVPFSIG